MKDRCAFDKGLYSEDTADLVEMIAAGKFRTGGDLLIDVISWFHDRGFELCDGDPNSSNRRAVELWGTAEYLLRILKEYGPEHEADHRELFERGTSESYAEYESANIRHRYHLVAAYGIEIAVLAAGLGLEPHIDDLDRGRKVLRGARQAHIETHGTPEEKAAQWAELQVAVDAARQRNPDASKAHILRIVIPETGKSRSTFQRHTTDPGPKK